jgi:excisionase family DNA binding protein
MPKDVSPAQAARMLGTTLDYIYKLIVVGKLTARKVGARWLVPKGAVLARLKAKEARNGTAGR